MLTELSIHLAAAGSDLLEPLDRIWSRAGLADWAWFAHPSQSGVADRRDDFFVEVGPPVPTLEPFGQPRGDCPYKFHTQIQQRSQNLSRQRFTVDQVCRDDTIMILRKDYSIKKSGFLRDVWGKVSLLG
jgi:hypothetical protein